MNTKPEPNRQVAKFIDYRMALNAIYRELTTNEFHEWANALYPNAKLSLMDFVEARKYFEYRAKLANRATVLAETLEAMATHGTLLEVQTYEYELSVWQSANRITEGN